MGHITPHNTLLMATGSVISKKSKKGKSRAARTVRTRTAQSNRTVNRVLVDYWHGCYVYVMALFTCIQQTIMWAVGCGFFGEGGGLVGV